MALDKADRDEIRTMLHDVVDPYMKAAEKRELLLNISLNNIDGHLEKLNDKVAKHEKTINVNLPHTVQHCPQVEIIKKLELDMVTWHRLKNVVITSIGGFGGVLTIAWLIFKLFIEKT